MRRAVLATEEASGIGRGASERRGRRAMDSGVARCATAPE